MTGLLRDWSSAISVCTPALASPSGGRDEHDNGTGREHVHKMGRSIPARRVRGEPAPVLIFIGEEAKLFELVLERNGSLSLSWSGPGEADEDVAMSAGVRHGGLGCSRGRRRSVRCCDH